MSDGQIQLRGLVKRFAGMDKPAVARLDCTINGGYVTGLEVADLDGMRRAGEALLGMGAKAVLMKVGEYLADLMGQGVLRRADPFVAAQQFKDLAISGVLQPRIWGVVTDEMTDAEIETQVIRAVDTFLRAYRPD